jgi:hypothetical protein
MAMEEQLNAKNAIVKAFDLDVDSRRVPADVKDDSGKGVMAAIHEALQNKDCGLEVNLGFYEKSGKDLVLWKRHTVAGTGLTTAKGKTTLHYRDSLTATNGTSINLGTDVSQPINVPADGSTPTFVKTIKLKEEGGKTYTLYPRIESILIECCRPKPKPTSCKGLSLPAGQYNVTRESLDDPAGHAPFIGDPFAAAIQVGGEAGAMNVSGNAPFVNVSGSIADDCSFVANGSGIVAGRSNVSVVMKGTADPSSGAFRGTYAMGVSGELPQGKAMTIGFSAAR